MSTICQGPRTPIHYEIIATLDTEGAIYQIVREVNQLIDQPSYNRLPGVTEIKLAFGDVEGGCIVYLEYRDGSFWGKVRTLTKGVGVRVDVTFSDHGDGIKATIKADEVVRFRRIV